MAFCFSDLNPLDSSLRSILKNKVYVEVPTNLKARVNESSENVRIITALMLSNVKHPLGIGFEKCLDVNGHRIERIS